MESIVLRKFLGLSSICLRTHDLGETNYDTLLRVTEDQAQRIVGAHTGIYPLFTEDDALPSPPPETLSIQRRQDRPAFTRSWILFAGEEQLGFVSDEAVRLLQKHAIVAFEPGEQNWKTREIEIIDDKLQALMEKKEELEHQKAVLLHDIDVATKDDMIEGEMTP